MSLDARLKKLEKQALGQSIHVQLRGGGTATIDGKRMPDIMRDVLDGKQTRETFVVLNAESSDEEGHMIELIQAIAAGPIPTPSNTSDFTVQ